MSIIFKVQIAASSKKLALKPYNFNGLDELSRQKNGKIWRYFYGQTKDYNQAVIMKDMVVSHGYTTAFVVAYLNGDRISIENAIKTKNN